MTFEKVKVGDSVYGTIYGLGEVSKVLANDSFYTFEVIYDKNNQSIFYTKEGIPSWAGRDVQNQTIFYKSEIDLFDYDFDPIDQVLTPKKILKLKIKKRLEMKCPSGIWVDVLKCPEDLFEFNVMNERFHLFRENVEESN